MEWVTSLKQVIEYVEGHLLDNIGADDVADTVHMSSFYLQKGFQIMTGYTIAEYIRNRRLYLSALDIVATDDKIIDVAYKYGYETPESFTKAFSRFHGVPPTQVKKNRTAIKPFLPLTINVMIQGGHEMDYSVEKMSGFKVIGYQREFAFESGYAEIPKFWDEVYKNKVASLLAKANPTTLEEETIRNCQIGEFGVCIDDIGGGKFRYLIAGKYTGGEVPEGMTVYEFPDMEWVKFRCVGPMPGALQSVNTKIFKEWLPGNAEFEIAMGANIEWYSEEGNTTDADYESAIWVPVKRK